MRLALWVSRARSASLDMTTSRLLLIGLLATACGSTMPRSAFRQTYTCDGVDLDVTFDRAKLGEMTAPAADRGDQLDRYVDGANEIFVPHDGLADATLVRSSERTVCIARGGYSDVITRYLRSASSHEMAMQLRLPDDEVRTRISAGWHRLGIRYRKER